MRQSGIEGDLRCGVRQEAILIPLARRSVSRVERTGGSASSSFVTELLVVPADGRCGRRRSGGAGPVSVEREAGRRGRLFGDGSGNVGG